MDDLRKQSRRFKVVKFNIQVPAWVFAKGMALMPEDAHIISCDYDAQEATNMLLVWSSHFAPVCHSKRAPELILEGNSETKEVSIAEVLDDGSWQYWNDSPKGVKLEATQPQS